MGDSAPSIAGSSDLDTEQLFTLLGRAYMLEILYEMAVHREPPIRFNELEESVDVSPNTLSRRLDELVEVGFLHRESYDEIPPRVEYEPTERLYAMEPIFRELGDWMAQYGADQEFVLPEE